MSIIFYNIYYNYIIINIIYIIYSNSKKRTKRIYIYYIIYYIIYYYIYNNKLRIVSKKERSDRISYRSNEVAEIKGRAQRMPLLLL